MKTLTERSLDLATAIAKVNTYPDSRAGRVHTLILAALFEQDKESRAAQDQVHADNAVSDDAFADFDRVIGDLQALPELSK